MDKYAFGKLIKALREQHNFLYGKLTQTKLSSQLSVSNPKIIQNVEQGLSYLSPDLLIKVANIFTLTTGERTEFLAMSSRINESERIQKDVSSEMVRDEMFELMSRIQIPAMLMDRFGDMLAINTSLFVAYDINPIDFITPPKNPITTMNIMRLLFGTEFRRQREMLGENWEFFASQSIKIFRAMSLRQRADTHFYKLLEELIKYPEFSNIWLKVYTHPIDHYLDNSTHINWKHPTYGELSFISSTVIGINNYSDLFLYTLIPASKNTYQQIGKIIEKHTNEVQKTIPSWPKKDYLLK